jgi:phosphate ABC transporter phosphate-binding protein
LWSSSNQHPFSSDLTWSIHYKEKERHPLQSRSLPPIDVGEIMKRLLALSTLLALMITGCSDIRTPKLNGTGSTQVELLFDVWAKNYTTAKVRYEAVGSVIGMDRFISQDFDFACTEVPLSAQLKDDASKNGITLVAIPLAFSAVVPTYHLEKVTKPVVFSGPVLVDIFLGKITSWDDKALQDLNPGVTLPKEPIEVIVRSDKSGTSYVWTDYLSQVSDQWKTERGVSSAPEWKKSDKDKKGAFTKFEAVAGTKGVVNALKKKAGSIGYLPLSAAKDANLGIGSLKIKDKTVEATNESVGAALKIAVKEIPADLMQLKLVNQGGDNAHPIIGTNWVIFSAKQKGDKGKQLVDFLRWAANQGQESLKDLNYARIPEALTKRIDKILDETTSAAK